MKTQPLNINSVNLACILATLEVPFYDHPDGSPPYVKVHTETGVKFTFQFEPTKRAEEIVSIYNDKQKYIEENSEEPLAYLLAFIQKRETLLDLIKKAPGLVLITKGNNFALISDNATEEFKQKALRYL